MLFLNMILAYDNLLILEVVQQIPSYPHNMPMVD